MKGRKGHGEKEGVKGGEKRLRMRKTGIYYLQSFGESNTAKQ